MKKSTRIVLLLALTVIMSCKGKTTEEKVHEAIKIYLHNELHDPASYEAINFDTLLLDDGMYIMRHDYRGKNADGTLIEESGYFWVDKGFHVVKTADEYVSKDKQNQINEALYRAADSTAKDQLKQANSAHDTVSK